MDLNPTQGYGSAPIGGVPAVAQNNEPGALVHPTENDIILGRGVLHAGHAGNIRFYAVIDQYIPMYNAAQTRTDKTRVVQIIYDVLTSVGRFVKEDPPSAACVVIDADAAKKKISHAIRYRRKPDRAAAATASTSRRTRSEPPRSRSNSPNQQLLRQQRRDIQQQHQGQRQSEGTVRGEEQQQQQQQTLLQQQQQHRPSQIHLTSQQQPDHLQVGHPHSGHSHPGQIHPEQLQLGQEQPSHAFFSRQIVALPVQPQEQLAQLHLQPQSPPGHLQQQPQEQLVLPPLQLQYQQLLSQAAVAQRARTGSGSPESLFGDEELDSVLLPPEVMAAAPVPHEDFFCDVDGYEDYDESFGSAGTHGR